MNYYKLDENKKPISCTFSEYCAWVAKQPADHWRVAKDQIGAVEVSTVFLHGIDYSFHVFEDDSPHPVLWETMVFGGEHDGLQERYSSYEDALKGHKQTVELCQK